MKIVTSVGDEVFEVEVTVDPHRERHYLARIGEHEMELQDIESKPGSITLTIDGHIGFYEFHHDEGRIVSVMHNNRLYRTSQKNPQQEQLEVLLAQFGAGVGGVATDRKLAAPMPGKILGINTAVGQTVRLGQIVYVLEAMKMENEISSTVEGKVLEIKVKVGDTVRVGDTILEVEPIV